ncbi:hypothetical protein M3Y94_00313000 [Aphelenchoides besseyi]|nr:hypothetical protein M3Y94_00313000 [Aphelenchoides besseyi]KAI6235716.1 hypothetical protein M3Y95_00080900 [Aphelenchoides besseyi]
MSVFVAPTSVNEIDVEHRKRSVARRKASMLVKFRGDEHQFPERMIQSLSSNLMADQRWQSTSLSSTRKISSFTMNDSLIFLQPQSPATISVHSYNPYAQKTEWIVPTAQQFLIPPITRAEWNGK